MNEPTRRNFDLEYIKNELIILEKTINGKLTIYIIGGAVMAMDGLKPGTKDIDIIVENKYYQKLLVRSLEQCNYVTIQPQKLTKPYKELSATILENTDGFRWDIFIKCVAKGLVLSNSMKKRTISIYSGEKLTVFRLSKEDIFLLKGITPRNSDVEDMSLIAMAGVDYKIVFDECISQSDSDRKGNVWEAFLNEHCKVLQSEYEIYVPFQKELEKKATEKMLSLRIMEILKKAHMTKVEILLESGGLNPLDIDEGLNFLLKKGKVKESVDGKFSLNNSKSVNVKRK